MHAISRRDPVTCGACGRRVMRKARQQKFCSDRCRQFALRENKARTAIKNPIAGQDSGRVTNPHFFASKNNDLQEAKSGFSVPLNLLGGYRWPDPPKLDRQTLENIRRAEIGQLHPIAATSGNALCGPDAGRHGDRGCTGTIADSFS